MQNKCAALSPILPAVFHTMSALSAPAGHLPLEGKAAIREYHLLKKAAHRPCEPIRSPSTVIPSAAEGSLLHCFSPFPHPRFTGLQEISLHFGPHDTRERRIVSYRFSYRCVELCLFEALYPAPLERSFSILMRRTATALPTAPITPIELASTLSSNQGGRHAPGLTLNQFTQSKKHQP